MWAGFEGLRKKNNGYIVRVSTQISRLKIWALCQVTGENILIGDGSEA